MAYRCDRCGKERLIGRQQRHKRGVAGGKWKRRAPKTRKISLPNLQSFKGILNGKKGKWRLCTKCLKVVKKEQKKSIAKKVSTTKSAYTKPNKYLKV